MRAHPLIYEINTWVWLDTLGRARGRDVTLADVDDAALDALSQSGADAVWLMGVWERSPRGRELARRHPDLAREYRHVLPDTDDTDVVGSPYSVRGYNVDPRLGGDAGLAAVRARLRQRGLGLVLDLVPNHVALDHPWVAAHPEALLPASDGALHAQPDAFFRSPAGVALAHGRDPHFPPWTDTAQVNALSPVLRRLLLRELQRIAGQCDGVRCDMAMLLLDRIFRRTWGALVADAPAMPELWAELIPQVKAAHPDFLFLAEVYWDLEYELQTLGFDYTYDKRLYDRLRGEPGGAADGVRDHLLAAPSYQRRLVRFVENHDEPRALTEFGPARAVAAATLALTLPGARLVHDGQLEGRALKLPVQLGRRPHEALDTPAHAGLRDQLARLVAELHAAPYHDGRFVALGTRPIVGSDAGHLALIAHAWALGDALRVVVVNYGPRAVSGRVMLPLWLPESQDPQRPEQPRACRLRDVLQPGLAPVYPTDELHTSGLPVHLPPWGAHLFVCEPAGASAAV